MIVLGILLLIVGSLLAVHTRHREAAMRPARHGLRHGVVTFSGTVAGEETAAHGFAASPGERFAIGRFRADDGLTSGDEDASSRDLIVKPSYLDIASTREAERGAWQSPRLPWLIAANRYQAVRGLAWALLALLGLAEIVVGAIAAARGAALPLPGLVAMNAGAALVAGAVELYTLRQSYLWVIHTSPHALAEVAEVRGVPFVHRTVSVRLPEASDLPHETPGGATGVERVASSPQAQPARLTLGAQLLGPGDSIMVALPYGDTRPLLLTYNPGWKIVLAACLAGLGVAVLLLGSVFMG